MFKRFFLIGSCLLLVACQSNSFNDKYVNKLKDSLKPQSEIESEIREQYLLANDYYYGFDREIDKNKACDIYQELALKNDPDSIHSYGGCFYFGDGRKRNNYRACELFERKRL